MDRQRCGNMSKQSIIVSVKAATELIFALLVVAVVVQNRVLRSRLNAEQASSGMAVHARISNVAATALDGIVRPILPLRGREKLLIIAMSPDCPACRAN